MSFESTEISICLLLPQALKDYALKLANKAAYGKEVLFINDNKFLRQQRRF